MKRPVSLFVDHPSQLTAVTPRVGGLHMGERYATIPYFTEFWRKYNTVIR